MPSANASFSTISPSRDGQQVDALERRRARRSARCPGTARPVNVPRRVPAHGGAVVLDRRLERPRTRSPGTREDLAEEGRARRPAPSCPPGRATFSRPPGCHRRDRRLEVAARDRRRSSARATRAVSSGRSRPRGCVTASRRSSAAPRFARLRVIRRARRPDRARLRRCPSPPASASSAAASACCPACGGCACRCRGRACRTATRGRSPPGDGIVLVDTGHARAGLARAPRAGARAGRTCGSSTSACSSARTRTPTTTARRRRSSSAPGCELWMHPDHAHMTARRGDPEHGARAPARGRPAERRARGAAAPLPGGSARARASASPRSSCPTATSSPGVDVRDRPGHVDHVVETPGHAPSHVVPLPARAPAADLRRPPARARLALLRLRLDARPRRGVPELARRVEALDARLCLAGHGRPFTDVQRARRRPTARSSPSALAAVPRRAGARAAGTAFEIVPERLRRRRSPR